MEQAFQELVESLEPQLRRLRAAEPTTYREMGPVPSAPGIYLFSEGLTPHEKSPDKSPENRSRILP